MIQKISFYLILSEALERRNTDIRELECPIGLEGQGGGAKRHAVKFDI